MVTTCFCTIVRKTKLLTLSYSPKRFVFNFRTSISYAATNINIIQNSQVSLADSGYDAKSLFDENDYTTE